MNELTIDHIRRAKDALMKMAIKPEPCRCIKYTQGVTLSCAGHTDPLTDAFLIQAVERGNNGK